MIKITNPRHFLLMLIPVLWLLAVTLPHLDQGDFRTDTGRYAAVGLQMWDNGDLLYSYTQPESPYFRKPPLGFWIHGFFLETFGVSLPTARLPSIVAAMLTVLLTYAMVRLWVNRLWAFGSTLILATTYEFTRRTREISLDHWQLLLMLGGTYVLVKTLLPMRNPAPMPTRWLLPAISAGALFGLSLLVKPLMGGIGYGVVGLWLFLSRTLNAQTWRVLLVCLVAMLIVGGSWHVYMYHEYGSTFLRVYLTGEVVERLEGKVNPTSWDFYWRLWLNTYWPWLLFLGASCWLWLKPKASQHLSAPERDLWLFASVWVVVWIVVLQILPDKRYRYGLIIYPFLAILSAYSLSQWPRFQHWVKQRTTLMAFIPTVLLIVLSLAPVRFQAPAETRWQELFTWMDSQRITPRNLWEVGVYDGDTSRFYLHYRAWPRPAIERLTGAKATLPIGSLLLYASKTVADIPANEQVLFNTDGLIVTRLMQEPWIGGKDVPRPVN